MEADTSNFTCTTISYTYIYIYICKNNNDNGNDDKNNKYICIYIYIIYIIYGSNTKPHVSYIILCVCVDPVTLSVMVSRTYSSRASEMSCPNFEV